MTGYKLLQSMVYLFVSLFLVLYLADNAYLFYKGSKLFSSRASAWIYSAVFLLLVLSLPAYFIFREALPYELRQVLYITGGVWLAFMLYLTLAFLLSACIRFFCCKLRKDRYSAIRFKDRYDKVQVIVSFVAVLAVLSIGYYRFDHPDVKEMNLAIKGKVPGKKSLRIVFISDLHMGYLVNGSRLTRYVNTVASLHPDMILLGGDLVDGDVSYVEKEEMDSALDRLSAPSGIYACPGNHEYYAGLSESMDFFKKTKITVLRDSSVLVSRSFYLVGRDDKMNEKRKSLGSILKGADRSKPVIVLDHRPPSIGESVNRRIGLQLSGHTHNGQLWPLNYIVRMLYKDAYGYRRFGRMQIYTSSGLGLWGPPFRVGTKSEIVVLNIKFV